MMFASEALLQQDKVFHRFGLIGVSCDSVVIIVKPNWACHNILFGAC